jgi:hypothetical protein
MVPNHKTAELWTGESQRPLAAGLATRYQSLGEDSSGYSTNHSGRDLRRMRPHIVTPLTIRSSIGSSAALIASQTAARGTSSSVCSGVYAPAAP